MRRTGVAGDRPGADPGIEEERFEVPLALAAARCGISVATLYKRIQAGTLRARQEAGGRRRWMLRPDDIEVLQSGHPPVAAAGEWSHDLVALLAEQTRELEAAHRELRELEGRAIRLETENSQLREKVRDLQNVLRAVSAAMGESVQALTMPDTAND